MIGGVTKYVDSEEYTLLLKDERGVAVEIVVYGIDNISSLAGTITPSDVLSLFPYVEKNRIHIPSAGDIELLIGIKYAEYHPRRIDNRNHLLLLENRFGVTVAGSHSIIKQSLNSVNHAEVLRTAVVLHTSTRIDALHSIESLGVSCTPTCGSCKCGKCHLGGKNMSIEEERDNELIESKLQFQIDKGRFIAAYPWIRNPFDLPNNRSYAYAMLLSTEKRLMKNEQFAKLYQRQIEDLLDRNVARKVTLEELQSWLGPKFFIAHHGVMKLDSKTTPYRLVFDSSHKFDGCALNDFLAKGPSFHNDLLGLLLRFREGLIGFCGDIAKMFHSVDIPVEDQMVHLFLWRDLETERDPDVYAITVVNMGDKPAAAIAQLALKKAAEMAPDNMVEAKETILENSYMDDILGSCETVAEANEMTKQITTILKNCDFNIKEWVISGQNPATAAESDDQKVVKELLNAEPNSFHQKVLGMYWDTKEDKLMFFVKLTTTSDLVYLIITKRIILSKCNSIYDPYGFLGPFIIKFKILLRLIWAHEPKLDWDTEVPEAIKSKWLALLDEMELIPHLRFPRPLKPSNATGDLPILVIFSDGSKQAYGAVAYMRWKTTTGFESRIIASKSRIAPLKVEDIVRLELCGALLSARLRSFITREMKISFAKIYHVVDSNIVKGMIKKASYGFNTFEGNRVGEIHRNSDPQEWHWVEGELNIADILSRGASPIELGEGTTWQRGPDFLQLDESEWPLDKLPDSEPRNIDTFVGIVGELEQEDSLSSRIQISRFSRFTPLIHTTARILKLYKRFKTGGVSNNKELEPSDLEDAKQFWIRDAQNDIHSELGTKKYIKLRPELVNGVFLVGGRVERWMEATWNKQRFILLPKEHRLSYLIALHEHQKSGHLATAATVSQIRSKYWIVGVVKIVNKIVDSCRWCKEKFKKFESQIMSPLPIERIKPSPPFLHVGCDYFGPYTIKGEVQKRIRGKAYGVIITCLSSRAVYVDLANNCSTDGFLQVYRRFMTIRGSPQKIFSDNGTNLLGASNELKRIIKDLNWEEIRDYGLEQGTEWIFSPADAPWYNGATEALVKSTKRALNAMVGESIFTFSGLQTALFEAAQLVNQRPIGIHPSKPDDGSYLCPNDLLLGRATSHIPQGPFNERASDKYRLDFIEKVTQCFWKRWTREIFPSLVINPKWHSERRNVQKGDVVLIEDANALRGKWKMGVVSEAIVSEDGKVRKVSVTYKNPNETVRRPVQKLIVIVPVEGDKQ